jgi:serine/threonine protein phosphatase 1
VEAEIVQEAVKGGSKALGQAVRRLRDVLPGDHLRFYRNLKLFCRLGDYFFVHAGVKPGVPLNQQSEDDLLWIRHEFLTSTQDYGPIIVHGHTPSRFPQALPNRIGLDTYAFRTDKLTACGFEGTQRWFLST